MLLNLTQDYICPYIILTLNLNLAALTKNLVMQNIHKEILWKKSN